MKGWGGIGPWTSLGGRPGRPVTQLRVRGRAWMTIRQAILTTEPLCRVCVSQARVVIAEEVDHILALDSGGTDDPENLQSLCRACHQAKTTRRATIGVDGWPIGAGGDQISGTSVLETGGHPKQT